MPTAESPGTNAWAASVWSWFQRGGLRCLAAVRLTNNTICTYVQYNPCLLLA